MTTDDVLAEHALARRLKQIDLDTFIALGIPVLALTRTWFRKGSFVGRERVIFDGQGRFEFERHLAGTSRDMSGRNVYTVLVFDAAGDPADIFAWRPDARGLWLGAVDVLGAEQLFAPRDGQGEGIDVWPDVTSWLVNERKGIVILDALRAFESLRCASPVRVQDVEQGQALRHTFMQGLPKILVRAVPPEPVDHFDRFVALSHGLRA